MDPFEGPGRDGPFGPPPGQNPASGFPAPVSHLESAEREALLRPWMMDSRERKSEALHERVSTRGSPPRTLAAPLKRPMPQPSDVPPECIQAALVVRDAIVAIVPFEHEAQPGKLFRYRVVPAALGFFFEATELRLHFLP